MKTNLDKILAVSGKPGIYQLITGGKSTIIVESLIDNKRMPVHPTQKVSSLSDISMFTLEEDVPLKEVFLKIKAEYAGAAASDVGTDSKSLRAAMKKVLPTYDSDIKKLFQWYNLLQANNMLDFETDENSDQETSESPE
ncbi:MAG: hypothetical protein RLZZ262_309 [Bacteroidota bacterium]